MDCKCDSFPKVSYLDNGLTNGFNLLDTDFELWKNLFQCKCCKQKWVVDEWEKYKTQFAIKVDDTTNWREIDYSYFEKQLVLESRGGTIDEPCIWKSCLNSKVHGTVYCIDHLYESGIRK